MAKKIFDIFPPKSQPKVFQAEGKEQDKGKGKNLFKKISIIIFLFFGLIIVISLQAYSEISVRPYQDSIKVKVNELKVSPSVENIDFENKIIPAQFFGTEKEISQEFSATGESFKEEKAEGIIRVYNAHNPPRSITLVANTRFLSPDGSKYFYCLEKIYIPAAKFENGKIVPGFIDVKVRAMDSGEEYNIGPSNFSIPGLVGSPYYYTIYGESSSDMAGGFKRKINIVTANDIKSAKDNLEEILLEQSINSLEESLPENFVLLSSAIFDEKIESSCSEKDGAEIPKFTCHGKIKINGLSFDKSFIKEIAQNIVLSEMSDTDRLIEKSLNIEYLKDEANLLEKEVILDIEISADTYKNIEEQVLKSKIAGKSQEKLEDVVFSNFPNIEKIKIKFWPFWIRKTSINLDKIRIKLNIEN